MSTPKLIRMFRPLRSVPSDKVAQLAFYILLQKENWAHIVGEYLDSLSDDEFFSNVLKVPIPKYSEPINFMLHEEKGHFKVMINLFELDRFNQFMVSGEITPHFHHTSFATRILSGSYWNILYYNFGDFLDGAKLRPMSQALCNSGTTYKMDFKDFHMVLRPANHTVSLMVRSETFFDREFELDEEASQFDFIIDRKNTITRVLAEDRGVVAGKSTHEFAFDLTEVLA